MNKLYLGVVALVSLVVMATSSGVAMAKGGSDNPAVVIIDQSGSSNDVDANITNDSSNPIPVTIQSQSQEVVNLVEQDSMSPSDVLTLPLELFIVPVGKRLVITSVAVDTGLNTCSYTLNPRIRISRPSTPFLVMFPLGAVSASVLGLSPVRYINQITYPVNIYAGPEDIIRFDLFRSNDGCSTLVRLSISGYLEDDV